MELKTVVTLLNFVCSFTLALILHELGHLVVAHVCRVPITAIGLGWGPRVYSRQLGNVELQLRLFPIGAFVRMDMVTFKLRPINQQLLVLCAGIVVNLVLAVITWGSWFGLLNFGLAIGNALPLYQQDGWKGAIVVCRGVLGRTSPLAEWAITLSGGAMALAVVALALIALS